MSQKRDYTFPKTRRLLRSNQFRRVSKFGSRMDGKYLKIQVCESKQSSLKLGLTVSRKFGKATKRNRFKRLVREAFRLSQHQLPGHLHLNVSPPKNFEKGSLELFKQELLSLVQSSKALYTKCKS